MGVGVLLLFVQTEEFFSEFQSPAVFFCSGNHIEGHPLESLWSLTTVASSPFARLPGRLRLLKACCQAKEMDNAHAHFRGQRHPPSRHLNGPDVPWGERPVGGRQWVLQLSLLPFGVQRH